jgi:hypothetical protein
MNHHDRLTKAYRGLTADQLAALAFHYSADANELELSRVADAVPLKEYRCPDVNYQVRLDGFTRFSACWSIEHWRLRCRKAELLGGALAALRRGDDEKADELLDAHEYAEKCLLALDGALLTICKEHGIDPADVRRMAGTEPFKARRADVEADAELQATMQSALGQIVEN